MPYVRRKPLSAPEIFAEGFRSPRNPSNPPHKVSRALFPGGDGLRPAGLSEWEHSPAVRHGGNASLAGIRGVLRPALQVSPNFERVKSFPLRGRGTAPRWMR